MLKCSSPRTILSKNMGMFTKSEIILFNFTLHQYRPKKVYKNNNLLKKNILFFIYLGKYSFTTI